MWKRTPSNDTKKTASARRLPRAVSATICILAILLLLTAVAFAPRTETMRVGNNSYRLVVADTDALRARGLGGLKSITPKSGMLFVFQRPGDQCFWMKDMHFSLDMIWTDANKRVVHMVQNLSPATYPHAFCAANAQYVIELNAGQAARSRIIVGQKLNF